MRPRHWLYTIPLRLRSLFRRQLMDHELDEELRYHIEQKTEQYVAQGFDPVEARRRAMLEMGGIERRKDECRETRKVSWLHDLMQDLRYGTRALRKSPGFTATAVVTLALGIGANTAIFSLINSLMLRKLPVREPDQLVELLHRYPGEPQLSGISLPAYQLMRDRTDVFSGLIASAYQSLRVRSEGLETQTVDAAYVDGTFFHVLGLEPAAGTLILPEHDQKDAPAAVAVVSWSYWNSRFSLDPGILGKQIVVEDVPVTIIGVTPRPFRGLLLEARQDMWLPLSLRQTISRRDPGWGSLAMVGRLRQGVPLEQAKAEMAVLYESTLDEQAKATNNPFIRKFKFEMEPAGAGLSRLRQHFATPLLVLMAMVAVLLLIACTNVASMLLARGAAREQEMYMRVALGASRFRLIRQMLTESLLLSLSGSLLGIWLAYLGAGTLVQIILSVRRPGPPLEFAVHLDTQVLIFTGGATVVTAILFGLAPALRAWRPVPATSLRRAGGSEGTKLGRFFAKALLSTQVALSVVLLSATSLFVRYLSNLQYSNLGFQREQVLLVTLDPAGSGYEGERLSRAYQELLTRLQAIPGVRSATICAVSPVSGAGANRGITVEGYEAKPGEIRNVMQNWVAPKYFETLGTPLLTGRDFSFQDQTGPRVAIINQTMARYYFGDGDAIGKHVTFDRDAQPYEIVGVAGDAKYADVRENNLRTIYLHTFQTRSPASQFALRTSAEPLAVAADVRRAVRDSLRNISVSRITTLGDQVDASLVPERLLATLSRCFGALGALLTAVGLYGLLAFTVARRTNEIGIRTALGASRRDIARLVLGQAFRIVGTGVVIGMPFAFWGKRFAASLIPDLPSEIAKPVAFGVAAMIVIALIAAYVPALRATRVDPMVALRHE